MLNKLNKAEIISFQKLIRQHYHQHGRHNLPWRILDSNGVFDPYKIMVSEIMLQQTQVNRVIPKYQEFIKSFPTIKLLARAPLAEILRHWSGLGYNRRAKFLHQSAQYITKKYQNDFPQNTEELVALPGVGKNTAGAILVYSFNKPEIFIETNIRTIYLHHFYKDQTQVTDAKLLPFIQATLDTSDPRTWYWALMDYGSYLKSKYSNINKASKHYFRQSKFEDSRRQLRGKVLSLLIEEPQSMQQIQTQMNDDRLQNVLQELTKEGLITHKADIFHLGK